MPLDPGAKRFLTLLSASGNAARSLTLEERRSAFNELMRLAEGDGQRCAIEDVDIAGPAGPLAIRIYTPTAVRELSSPALLYLHGGGWIAGGRGTHDGLCMRLAAACALRIVMVDYRLAPEHKFPAALDDALCATEWLMKNGGSYAIDSTRLGLCGDSAGANIAAGICLSMKKKGYPPLALQLLLCPILDAVGDLPSRQSFATGYFLNRAMLENDFEAYCPRGLDRLDARISPLRAADLSGLPPTHIHTAEFDPDRDEGRIFSERLAAAAVPVVHRCHSGMIHLFYAMPGFVPLADFILRDVGLAVSQALRA